MANRIENKWLILGIDFLTIIASFFLAYLIRFNFTTDFDMSAMAQQTPVIVLITLLAFMILGSYRQEAQDADTPNFVKVFKAICLSVILIILLGILNSYFLDFPGFTIPLSIAIIYSWVAFLGLWSWRSIFRVS